MPTPKTITLRVLTNVATFEMLRSIHTGKLQRTENILLGAGEHITVPLSDYVSEEPRMTVINRHDVPVSILKSNTIVIQ